MNEKQMRKLLEGHATEDYIKLVKFLYDKHREILREYEKDVLKTKLRIEFL